MGSNNNNWLPRPTTTRERRYWGYEEPHENTFDHPYNQFTEDKPPTNSDYMDQQSILTVEGLKPDLSTNYAEEVMDSAPKPKFKHKATPAKGYGKGPVGR